MQPGASPRALNVLIIVTACVNIFSALTDRLFNWLFSAPGPQDWFSLSWWGMTHSYIWQPISYLFVQHSGFQGITFFYLIALFFNLYILWILGSIVCEKIGTGPFLRFYFVTGAIAGLLTLSVMPLVGSYISLAGPTASLLGLLVIWTLFNPETELLLFFLFPVKVKWLTTAIVGITALITLSQLDLIHFVFYLSGAACGYFYVLLAWNLDGPFPFTHPFDHLINKIGIRFRRLTSRFRKKKGTDKVVDIKTGRPLDDDDHFVDEMLKKISRYGEASLSWSEKRRLDEISKKKAQKK